MRKCPRCGYADLSDDPMRTRPVSAREMEVLIGSETAKPSEPPTVPNRREVIEQTVTEPEIEVVPESEPVAIQNYVLVAITLVAFVVALGILIASGIGWR